MPNPIHFDHIEVHVWDIPAYGEFLVRLFGGGRVKVISDSGTSMFISPEGLRIEIKAARADEKPGGAGFCLPCIRLEGARAHIESLGLQVSRSASNEAGEIHFFTDPQGIEWHAKDHALPDASVSW